MTRGPRKNEELLHHREVRVVGALGEQLGVISTADALRMARDQGLDLVEVNPKATPAVCKLMDFTKFKYAMAKSRRKLASDAVRLASFSVVSVNGNVATQEFGLSFLEIRRAILSTQVDRGTEFRLAVPGRSVIVARSRSTTEPAEFEIRDGDTVVRVDADRSGVVACIERLLALGLPN